MGHCDAQQQDVPQYLGGQCVVARREQRVAPRRLARARAETVHHLLVTREMAGLHCVCGDSFMASCDIDPGSCAVAWLLLIVSTMVHAARCCAWGGDDEGVDSDGDGEPCTMYT